MTAVGRENAVATAEQGTAPDDWVRALSSTGPEREEAQRQLHGLLLRAARHQVHRMQHQLRRAGPDHLEEIANQAADEAMVALLGKLATFEGRSRFTTWAYKFAVLQTATEMRRLAWSDREVNLDDRFDLVDLHPSPEQHAEASETATEILVAIRRLSPHQRRVVIALLVDQVPIDVLADRLGSSRNALYKTVHDARVRIRAHLIASGHLPALSVMEATHES